MVTASSGCSGTRDLCDDAGGALASAAAFASRGQCDGNGLIDRFFLCRRMTGAYRPILFPVIHQCLDIAADDRLAGSFSERHDIPPVCKSMERAFHQLRCYKRTSGANSILPVFLVISGKSPRTARIGNRRSNRRHPLSPANPCQGWIS